jgi:hypothetical protein
MSDTKRIADSALNVALEQIKSSVDARKPRFDDIRKNEDMFNGKKAPALKGRSNIPFDTVVMGGFTDTLMSKIDDPLTVVFNRFKESDLKKAEKMTAVWDKESGADKGDWEGIDLDAKFLAILSGRGTVKFFAESSPKFRTDISVVDHYDLVTEPMGGRNLDLHMFKGQMNIFRTKDQIQEMVGLGAYDKTQVRKMIFRYSSDDFKKNTDIYEDKHNRFQSMGINVTDQSFVGEPLFKVVEWIMMYQGEWYYMVFNYETKTWLRFELLKDVFSIAKEFPGRGPWNSYATHREPFAFWSKAPADDIRPIAYTMKKVLNLSIDNLEKRNWDMKAFDPKIFTNSAQLLYKQDGLARATLRAGQKIDDGIYQFQTPDTTGITINLVEYMNNFMGRNTGITPDAQGASDEKRVGILVSNLQQVSDRLGLINKMYKKMHVDLGNAFKYGVIDNLREDYAVKLVGLKGVEWDSVVKRDDLSPDFGVTVKGGADEDKNNELAARKKELALTRIEKNPALQERVNPDWFLREVLEEGGFEHEDIRVALDTQNYGDDEILAEAAEAIEMCMLGEEPKENRGATTGFVRKITDFIEDNDVNPEQYQKLMDYAKRHVPIAQKNMIRKAESVIATQGGQIGPEGQNVSPVRPTELNTDALKPAQPPQDVNQPII